MKMKLTHVMVLLTWIGFAQAASTDSLRHASTVREFRKTHACPATGLIQTSCKGYVVDHIVPLCAGGPDTVDNMMYQTTADSYRKDVLERDICRRLKTCTGAKK